MWHVAGALLPAFEDFTNRVAQQSSDTTWLGYNPSGCFNLYKSLEGIVRRFTEIVYSIMRIVVGFLFACHGAQKLFGVLGGRKELQDVQGLLGGIIEFGAGIAVAIGLFTAIAAFIASGEMAVAYFKAHAPHGFWPILNHGELAVLYCFVFLYISSRGDGTLSLRRLAQKGSAK